MTAKIIESADFLRANPEYKNPRPGTMTSTCVLCQSLFHSCERVSVLTIAEATIMYEVSPGLNHWLTLMTAV